jgi:hypothetical protein
MTVKYGAAEKPVVRPCIGTYDNKGYRRGHDRFEKKKKFKVYAHHGGGDNTQSRKDKERKTK